MKARNFIAGLLILLALIFSSNFASAQDDAKGTFIDESGEKQDSSKKADIFDFSGEYDENESSSTGIIIGLVAVVLVGGGAFFLLRKKK